MNCRILIGAQEAGPEGHQHPQNQHVAGAHAGGGKEVGDGVAGHDAEQRRPRRDSEGDAEHLDVDGGVDEPGVVHGGERAVGVDHAEPQELCDRKDEEHREEHEHRQQRGEGTPCGTPAGRRFGTGRYRDRAHAGFEAPSTGSTTVLWRSNPKRTGSPGVKRGSRLWVSEVADTSVPSARVA